MWSISTAEFRNAFLKTIRQIIRESVRNMSIPTAKPLSNSPAQLVSNTATLGRQTISTRGIVELFFKLLLINNNNLNFVFFFFFGLRYTTKNGR